MKKFKVEIIELLSKVVEIEATDEEKAYLKAKEMYNREEIVLDSSDFQHVTFKTDSTHNNNEEKDKLLADIIDYLYEEEKKHHEEFGENKPTNHIFLKLRRAKELI